MHNDHICTDHLGMVKVIQQEALTILYFGGKMITLRRASP
jgi:hypothetical protein